MELEIYPCMKMKTVLDKVGFNPFNISCFKLLLFEGFSAIPV